MKIVIDGNIGSGKTTQLSLLSAKGWKVVYEPIEQWPLELFYSDMERWGFLFQIVILQTLKIVPGDVIYERSPLSSKEVFWQIMKKTEVEDETYNRAFDQIGWGPDVYILIDTPPDTCLQHMKTREQAGDTGVSLEYLHKLDEQYKKMYDNLSCPKIKIDGTKTIQEIHESISAYIVNVIKLQEERLQKENPSRWFV